MSRRRPLTSGEIALVRRVFGQAIDCARVRVRQGRFLPFTGDNAMAPLGVLHFPPGSYRADFSAAPPATQVWFIHEMAHVWQHQLGLSVLWHGIVLACKGGYRQGGPAYAYDPVSHAGRTLRDFNMEQQAELIAHHFDARHLAASDGGRQHPHRARLLPFYEAVLADFLRNPADASLLPRHTRVDR